MSASTAPSTRAIPAALPSFKALVSMEMLKLRKRPMTLVVFALVMGLIAAFMLVGYIITATQGTSPEMGSTPDYSSFLLPGAIENGFSAANSFGSILLVVLGAAIIGSEFSWGTVRVLVSSGASRSKLLAAKLFALGITSVLFIIAGVVATIITSIILTVAGGHPLTLSWLNSSTAMDILLILIRTEFVLLVPIVLAFFFAVVTRSLAAGIALGIGITIVESIASAILGGFRGIGETISHLLITPNISAINALNRISSSTDDGKVVTDIDPWRAALLLSGYMVIMLVIAFAVFRRRDIASGS